MSKKKFFVVIVVWTMLVVLVYGYGFYPSELSSATTDWANFTIYLTGLITLPLSFFAAYYTYQNYQENLTKNHREAAERAIERISQQLDNALNKTRYDVCGISGSVKELLLNSLTFSDFLEQIKHNPVVNMEVRAHIVDPLIALSLLLTAYESEFGSDYLVKSYISRYRMLCFRLGSAAENIFDDKNERAKVSHFWKHLS